MVSSPWAMSAATVAFAVVMRMAVFEADVVTSVMCSPPGLSICTRRPSVQIDGSVSRAPLHCPAITRHPRGTPARLDKHAGACAFPRGFEDPSMHRYRSHTCGELREADVGREARLSGWCHRIRDHGGLLFIDLRDHYVLTQCVADPDSPVFKEIEKLRSEWVVRLDGKLRLRPVGTENPDLPTGAIELFISGMEVLGSAGELPMPVFGEQDYPEEIRLKYRFLDLRREHLHQNIMKRGAIIDSIRRRMKAQGFFEFQTPILTASSPEGARDYLVPSRLHPGKFYALPQAPQQFKQLIMVAG